jgi:C4-dicarboxylate transporter DctM subunit
VAGAGDLPGVVGGIYTGIFTPTEGAAVGAFGTGVAAWAAGGLNARTLRDAFYGTAAATGMIFMIVLGAGLQHLPGAVATAAGTGAWVIARRAEPLAGADHILVVYLIWAA